MNLFQKLGEWFAAAFVPEFNFKVANNSTVCRACGRDWQDRDAAAMCQDWDRILGTERHHHAEH